MLSALLRTTSKSQLDRRRTDDSANCDAMLTYRSSANRQRGRWSLFDQLLRQGYICINQRRSRHIIQYTDATSDQIFGPLMYGLCGVRWVGCEPSSTTSAMPCACAYECALFTNLVSHMYDPFCVFKVHRHCIMSAVKLLVCLLELCLGPCACLSLIGCRACTPWSCGYNERSRIYLLSCCYVCVCIHK